MVINGKYSNDNDESDNECDEDNNDDVYNKEDQDEDGDCKEDSNNDDSDN